MLNQVKQILLLSMAVFVIFSGCSSGRFGVAKRRSGRLVVPAGVDSTVAMRADTLANDLFVSLLREQRSDRLKSAAKNKTSQSDTLWKYLSNDFGPEFEVSQQNKARAVEAFNKGAVSLQKLSQLDQGTQDALTKIKIEEYLKAAQMDFENAIVFNPFDLETRSWLARVYQSLAARFLDDKNHKKAVNVLENLLRIERGEHALFARLAETYYAIENWPAAHHGFQMAESVMRGAAGLDFSEEAVYGAEAPLDTAALFYYAYYQGDTEIKMHKAEKGLISLNRALKYAASEKERSDVLSYIDWIDWDDGNTRAVEKRDEYLALIDAGEYNKAAKGFLQLMPNLRTRRAADEVRWRLAVLEFQHLQRQNKGIDRLKDVIKFAAKDAAGAAVDTSYQRYFDSYGVMCHNLGLENIRKNRRFAFMYFQQAVAIQWENRAKSYLEIGKMSRNNPDVVIKNCESVLKQPDQLDSREQMQTYQLLVEALKRRGKFNEARRYYAAWMQLRNGTRRASR